jgi:hypothetical protein
VAAIDNVNVFCIDASVCNMLPQQASLRALCISQQALIYQLAIRTVRESDLLGDESPTTQAPVTMFGIVRQNSNCQVPFVVFTGAWHSVCYTSWVRMVFVGLGEFGGRRLISIV